MDKSSALQAALSRLQEQRNKDYLQPWKPGMKKTDSELIWRYIKRLEEELSLTKDELFLHTYRDDMGR